MIREFCDRCMNPVNLTVRGTYQLRYDIGTALDVVYFSDQVKAKKFVVCARCYADLKQVLQQYLDAMKG